MLNIDQKKMHLPWGCLAVLCPMLTPMNKDATHPILLVVMFYQVFWDSSLNLTYTLLPLKCSCFKAWLFKDLVFLLSKLTVKCQLNIFVLSSFFLPLISSANGQITFEPVLRLKTKCLLRHHPHLHQKVCWDLNFFLLRKKSINNFEWKSIYN